MTVDLWKHHDDLMAAARPRRLEAGVRVCTLHYVHLPAPYLGATRSLQVRVWSPDRNQQLTDPVVDPDPVGLLVLHVAEEG